MRFNRGKLEAERKAKAEAEAAAYGRGSGPKAYGTYPARGDFRP
jgi:hypothetical protein